MLKISKLADYSSVIMAFLATNGAKKSAREISCGTKISHPTVTKLLKILLKASFLRSALGSQGGYELAKPADQITLLDIVNSIDGDFSLTECSRNISDCNVFKSCHISNHWRTINLSIKETLQGVTLSDLLLNKNTTSPKRRDNLMNVG